MVITRADEKKNFGAIQLYENVVCDTCRTPAKPEIVGRVYDHEYRTSDDAFTVVRCTQCGTVYLNPRPAVGSLGLIYPKNYYSYSLYERAGSTAARPKSLVQRIFLKRMVSGVRQRLLQAGMKLGDGQNRMRVLDVGCGVGAQLDAIKAAIGDAETHGIEMGAAAAEKARSRGHQVYAGRFEDQEIPEGYFDLVFSSHTIEHVESPRAFLEKCKRLLKPDGVLIIETPNTDCLDFKLWHKRHWGGYHAPRHWYLFSPASFGVLAKAVGMEVKLYRSYCSPAFWNWSLHSICSQFLGPRISDKLFPPREIFYGGAYAFVLLGLFSLIETVLLKATGKASAFWVVLRR